jgi:hypothetical protein
MLSLGAFGFETRTWQVGDAPDATLTWIRLSPLGGIWVHFPHEEQAMLKKSPTKSAMR